MYRKKRHGSISKGEGLRPSLERIFLITTISLCLVFALPERTDAADTKAAGTPGANVPSGIALTLGTPHRSGTLLQEVSSPTEKEADSIGSRDNELAQKIIAEIRADPFIESRNIRVAVNDGVAILRGSVRSWTEYAAATADAFQSGANEVKNQLQVVGQTLVAGHRK